MRILTVAVALLCAVSGCTSDEPQEPGPLPKVNHPKAAVPVDRDDHAVTAALARLDACSLLDPGLAKLPGFSVDAPRDPRSPFRCRIRSAGGLAHLSVGTVVIRQTRYILQPLDLGGVKAYLDPKDCTIAIPVSFRRTIFVDPIAILDFSDDKCAIAKGFATAAAAKLANPVLLPRARWDACTALRSLTRREPDLVRRESLDQCQLTSNLADGRIQLRYTTAEPDRNGKTVWTVGGRRAVVSRTAVCYLTWLQGPSGVSHPRRSKLEVTLTVDCAKARQLATALVKILDGPAPQPQPQRTLVYRTGEPDQARAGACVDVMHDPCEPYHPVDAPKGAKELARRADADPHVRCAIAVEAVGRHLGSRFRPVVAGSGSRCYFGEPSHTVEVEVWVGRGSLPSTGESRTVAGRQAKFSASQHTPDYTLSVAADGVVLEVRISLVGLTFANRKGPEDRRPARNLEPIATGIVERFF